MAVNTGCIYMVRYACALLLYIPRMIVCGQAIWYSLCVWVWVTLMKFPTWLCIDRTSSWSILQSSAWFHFDLFVWVMFNILSVCLMVPGIWDVFKVMKGAYTQCWSGTSTPTDLIHSLPSQNNINMQKTLSNSHAGHFIITFAWSITSLIWQFTDIFTWIPQIFQ